MAIAFVSKRLKAVILIGRNTAMFLNSRYAVDLSELAEFIVINKYAMKMVILSPRTVASKYLHLTFIHK